MINTLTATDLALEWRNAGYPFEFTASDGTFLICYIRLDMDYDMSYLLNVNQSSAWIHYRQLHAPRGDSVSGVTVEWRHDIPMNQPFDAMERHVEWSRQVMTQKL